MKDSWVTDTVIQEATLAMELPASPASQCNQTTAELPSSKSTDQKSTQNNRPLDHRKQEQQECTIQRNCEDKEQIPCSKEKKEEWCSQGIAVFMSSSPSEISLPNQSKQCDNQPMDISESVECIDEQEQIVPQSVASCEMPGRNASDDQMTLDNEQKETTSVRSRIMKMGLKDLLNEVDHEHGLKETSSNQTALPASTMPTSFPYQNQKSVNLWHGHPRHGHKIFGPLARPVSPFTSQIETPTLSSSVPPENKFHFRERAGSPIITHKKFDYQKKLLSNSNTPLNLCKRSPTRSETVNSVVKDESAPMDLTTKKPKQDVQCSSIQTPVNKVDTLFAPHKHQDFFLGKGKSHFLFGAKPELDHYTPPRMPSFFLPRSSSCSPLSSSSEHSSSSAVSMIEQRSDPETATTSTSDVKPTPEMLSQITGNISMVPAPLRLVDKEIHAMPTMQSFDPVRLNELYMQQFATKFEGGMYQLPANQCLGYTTTICSPQPSSPSKIGTSSKPDKMFICQECRAVFKHRHHVVRHMRSHSGERPFRCDECGATFARKCILTNHKRTHTGEKPYICTECGDTFSRKHHLVIHRRTHTGEKPYKCPHCGAAFARSHHLNRHRKTHIKMDALAAEGTNGMFFPQVAGGLPLQGMQGLPTMLPLFPHALIAGSTPLETQESMQEQNQDHREEIQSEIGEKNESELEEREGKSEVSDKSTTADELGANNPASSKNESLSD